MDYNTTLNDLSNFSQSELNLWNEIQNKFKKKKFKKLPINPIEYSKVISIRKSKLIGDIEFILN